MPNCPRCHAMIDGGAPYCAVCGRPRIAEGLRVPMVQPDWQKRVLQGLIAVGTLWLFATIGVAFLREAKAVRDSRSLLAAGKPQEAWAKLGPFLAGHPRHKQALFLGGKATVRLGLNNDAKRCLTTLGERSPKLAVELGTDYRQALTAKTRADGCSDASNFAQRLAWAEELGDAYVASVLEGLDAVVEACLGNQNGDGPSPFIAALAQRNQAEKMAEKGYAPVIRRALAEARYGDAYNLAQEAVRLVPAGEAAIKGVMDGERQKVSATVATLRQLCERFKTDARYHPSNSWCFPATAPPDLASARDGWGRPVSYIALGPDETQRCHQGFALSSLGGDGMETEDRTQTPADEIVCRFVSGAESWVLPPRYWMVSEEGG